MGVFGAFCIGTYCEKCTEYTTHMRVHAILKVGLGMTKYHKAPRSSPSCIGLFRLKRTIMGPLSSWPRKPRETIPFQFGVSLDVFQNRSIMFTLLFSQPTT